MNNHTGRTAVELARDVRAGHASAVDVVRDHLDRIATLDGRVGAFQVVLAEQALTDAAEVDRRPDRANLPLAGVPVAIKDNIAVRGVPMLSGSPFADAGPSSRDHVVVERLRAAGAVVVGTTRLPELGVWPFTDGPLGTARNPWNLDRTAGGSSGGSAAAVAAGFVPLAHGNDGLGSIRIPAACCGLVGLKPGRGLVPVDVGVDGWTGMVQNGPLATTVADAALGLSVMAADPALAELIPPATPLRIALSLACPVPGVRVDPHWLAATRAVADLLRGAGHEVVETRLPAPLVVVRAGLARWFAGPDTEADRQTLSRLPRRTGTHARFGRYARRLGWVRTGDTERCRAAFAPVRKRFDVVLSPGLASPPPPAQGRVERGWLTSYRAAVAFSGGLQGPWNLADWPSLAVPAGLHPDGTPLAVQLSSWDGGEGRLLGLAAELERQRPWQRRPDLGQGAPRAV